MHPEDQAEPSAPPLSTWFAPAARAPADELQAAMAATCNNPVLDAILRTVGCVVAVLNGQRQILAINDVLLRVLGLGDPASVLGLRPGEALGCVHAHEEAGGCGTSRACSQCGAVISILMAQASGSIEERECLVSLSRSGQAMELRARAVPMRVDGRDLVVLLLQDIRDQKRREALERTFFHDMRNTLTGLLGCTELMHGAGAERVQALVPLVETSARQLLEEVESYRLLALTEAEDYHPVVVETTARKVLDDVATVLQGHGATRRCTLRTDVPDPGPVLRTDVVLLRRLLVNMGRNALEATSPGGTIRMWVEEAGPGVVTWHTWNDAFIPPEVAMRVFQRSFSTKGEPGRGLGTYGMRLLCERYLGGRVWFDTSREAGTTFHARHPVDLPASQAPVATGA